MVLWMWYAYMLSTVCVAPTIQAHVVTVYKLVGALLHRGCERGLSGRESVGKVPRD